MPMGIDVPAWRSAINPVVTVSRILPLPVYLGTDSNDQEKHWVSRKTRRVLAAWGELIEVHTMNQQVSASAGGACGAGSCGLRVLVSGRADRDGRPK